MENYNMLINNFIFSYNINKKSHTYRELKLMHKDNIFKTYINNGDLAKHIVMCFNGLTQSIKNKLTTNIICELSLQDKTDDSTESTDSSDESSDEDVSSEDDSDSSDDDESGDKLKNKTEIILELMYNPNMQKNDYIKEKEIVNICYSVYDTSIDFYIGLDDVDYKKDVLQKIEATLQLIKTDYNI